MSSETINLNQKKEKAFTRPLALFAIILVTLAGLFSPAADVQAQAVGQCWYKGSVIPTVSNETECLKPAKDGSVASWQKQGDPIPPPPNGPITGTGGKVCVLGNGSIAPGVTNEPDCNKVSGQWTTQPAADSGNDIEKRLSCATLIVGDITKCLIKISYYIFYVIPASLLAVAAIFFNSIIAIALSSVMYTADFISKAWAIVRDLANIFFILILLYIAIKIILGLGGEVKKMIAHVIIMALLINFSMFFTKVIIDSSNILALVFYNNINVSAKEIGTGEKRPYSNFLLNKLDKDISGGIVSSFDPTRLMSNSFFEKAAMQMSGISWVGVAASIGVGALIGGPFGLVVGAIGAGVATGQGGQVPDSLMLTIILVAGSTMALAAYAFFVAGIAFVSRLVELWTLIIFSPFAFMSFSIPELKKYERFGFDAWLKKLLEVAFMAPIFMFMMYLIFLLVNAKIWNGVVTANMNTYQELMFIVLQAIIVLTLLLSTAKYAKKSSGALGELMMKGAKIIGGVALGAAAGGVALAGRGLIGGVGGAAASKLAEGANRMGLRGTARGLQRIGQFASTSSFDARGIKIAGKDLAGATGLKLGEARKGGITQTRKEKVEKRIKRNEELKVGENEGLKQELNKTEADLQSLLVANAQEIENLDKTIEKKRQEAADAERRLNAARGTPGEAAAAAELTTKNSELNFAKDNKKDFLEGRDYMNSGGGISNAGGNIDALEKQKKSDIQAIKTENAARAGSYANAISGNIFSKTSTLGRATNRFIKITVPGKGGPANREAAHKIRMDVKLDSGTKT